jgi:hypothetical protein
MVRPPQQSMPDQPAKVEAIDRTPPSSTPAKNEKRTRGLEVIEEQPPSSVRFNTGPIEVELLVTIVRADPNHVSFIGNNVSQRELFKKTAQCGIGLAFGHPRLDRNRDVIGRPKLKTYNRMTDQG